MSKDMSEVKPIYLYRRKGLASFADCNIGRFTELSESPLFETQVAYHADDYDALRAELDNCQRAWGLQRSEIDALRAENERNLRIQVAMSLAISAVGEALGVPAEEQMGGTGEFIAMIAELRAQLDALKDVPDGVDVVGYGCAGQIEVLRHVPLTGGMKVSGRERERYTVPLMTVAQHNAIVAALRQPVADERGDNLRAIHAMVLSALDRDAAEGKQARGEMAAELRAALSAPGAGQDVSALVEALEASNLLLRTKRHACSSNELCRVLDVHIERNNAALAAHKAGGCHDR